MKSSLIFEINFFELKIQVKVTNKSKSDCEIKGKDHRSYMLEERRRSPHELASIGLKIRRRG